MHCIAKRVQLAEKTWNDMKLFQDKGEGGGGWLG